MENGSNAVLCDTYTFCGDAGATRMYNLLRLLCHDVPADLGGRRVRYLLDHEHGIELDLTAMRTRPLAASGATAVELVLDAGSILLTPAADSSTLKVYVTASDGNGEALLRAMRTWIRQRT